ncbi:HD-domain/PDEase-like protein [Hesseltinella vesiculosa]|uniref:Phosphodiesterase n=1 Tax=Hesseltinella vesiculosa TaxID=101127 RepID=A0A1X2GQW3_9FUNG|nr:HD-domain/PDEase-like protein [Hesseltinella vesiculosa]
MLILKHNQLPANDLFIIERHLVRWLQDKVSPKITPDWHVLDLNRTDLYGHLLGLLGQLDLFTAVDRTASAWLDFLVDVDRAYQQTPYHSFYHAADIVVMLYYVLVELDGMHYLQTKDLPCLLVAALCHDVGHPGYNNLYQVKAKTDLAKRYSDSSVLENYSLEIAIDLVEKHKLFEALVDDWKTQLEQLILSTDMKYHDDLQDLALQMVKALSDRTSVDNDWPPKAHLPTPTRTSFSPPVTTTLTSTQRHDFCRIILHAADISNTVRPWPIAKQWSDLIVQEFFRQGDAERRAGLAISPGMDRHQSNQVSISLSFGDAVIQPYFDALHALLPKAAVFTQTLASNRHHWLQLEKDPHATPLTLLTPQCPPPFPYHAPSDLPTPTPTTSSSSSSSSSASSMASSLSSTSTLLTPPTLFDTPPLSRRRVSVPSTSLFQRNKPLTSRHPCRIVKPTHPWSHLHRHSRRPLRLRHPSPCHQSASQSFLFSDLIPPFYDPLHHPHQDNL